jgi:Tfp pilus assembly protein PilF
VTLQDSARALSALQRSLALSPTDEDSFNIGLLLQDLSQTKRAGVIFAELARKHPREARFLNAQGICAYLNGSAPRAEAALSSAIRADPRHWPAYLSLGFVLEKMGRRPEAGALYRRALALSSVNGAVIAQRDRDELISLAASIPEQPKIDARNQ